MPATPNILSPHHKLLDLLNRLSDVVLLAISLVITLFLLKEDWPQRATVLLLFAIIYHQISGSMSGIYESQRSLSILKQVYQTIIALIGTFILVTMTSALSNRLHSFADRNVLFIWFIVSVCLLCLWRVFLHQTLSEFRRRGINTRYAAVAGAGELARSLAFRFAKNPWMGVKIVGFYENNTTIGEIDSIPVVANFEQLIEDAKQNKFDRIYITLPLSEQETIKKLIDELSDTTCNVFLVPDVFVFDLMNSRQTSIDGLPAIGIYDTPFTLFDSVIKRGFDICTALGILAFIALPMLAIAIAVKTTSKGPVIFKQIRYGLDGKPIYVWKFRSMTSMDNGSVVKQATKNDARITPLGGFLRRTSLDELPQFINVLQGQMSIVGPRPHAVAHNEEYRKLIKGYMLRHKVKPGITGWAQINGWRGETDTLDKMEKRVEYDLAYIRNWTVWLDVKIVFLTVFKGFVDKNAY